MAPPVGQKPVSVPPQAPPSRPATDTRPKTSPVEAAEAVVTVARKNVKQYETQIASYEKELKELRKQMVGVTNPFTLRDLAVKIANVEAKMKAAEILLNGAQATLTAARQHAISVATSGQPSSTSTSGFIPHPVQSATLSQQQAVKAAAAQINAEKSPYQAAALLQQAFRTGDAEFQAALWAEVKGRLPDMVKAGDLPTMRALVGIAEHGGIDVERDIAAALAKNAPTDVIPNGVWMAQEDPFRKGTAANLAQALKETGRLDLAQRFVEALNGAGKPQAASAMAQAAASQLSALRTDFEAKQKKVDQLNAKLGMLIAGFGPMMTDEQKRAAITAFQARHTDEYKAFEASAKKLAQGLKMVGEISEGSPKTDGEKALREQANAVLKIAGAICNTKAGEAELKAAMEQEARGGSSWVSTAMSYAQTLKDGEKIASTLGTAVVRTLATEAVKLTEANLPLALEKIESIAHYAKMMGVDPARADALSVAMVGMMHGRQNAGEALDKAVLDLEGTPLISPDGAFSKALKGVGIALSVYSLGKSGFGDDALDKLKNINAGLNVTADALALGLSIVGRGEALKGFAEGASKKLGVIAGAFDLVSGYRSLARGDYEEAGTTLASSAGALLMLTPGGQIPGAILTVGSFIASMVFASRKANKAEAADEADAKAFLVAGGIHPDIAAPLSDLLQKDRRNVGPFLQQLSEYLGMSPADLISRFNKPEMAGKLRELVTILKAIEPGKDGTYAQTSPNDAAAKESGYRYVNMGGAMKLDLRPKSVAAVVDWMKQNKMFGG
ncbi:MAG: hypothetical protein ACO1OB_34615 [Archangium sp.]